MRYFILVILLIALTIPMYSENVSWYSVWNEVQNRTFYKDTVYSTVWHKGKKEFNVYLYTYDNGDICLQYIDGKKKGTEACYSKKTNKVRAHRGGILSKIILTLSPNDKKVKNERGRGILESTKASYMALLDTTSTDIKVFNKDSLLLEGKTLENNEQLIKVSFLLINNGMDWNLYSLNAYDSAGIAYKMIFKTIK